MGDEKCQSRAGVEGGLAASRCPGAGEERVPGRGLWVLCPLRLCSCLVATSVPFARREDVDGVWHSVC